MNIWCCWQFLVKSRRSCQMVSTGNVLTSVFVFCRAKRKWRRLTTQCVRFVHWAQYNWSGNMAAFLKSPERRHHTYPACDMRGHARHAGYVRWRRPSNMCCCSSNKWTFTKKMTSQWIRRRNDVVSLPSINQCQWDLRLHSSIIELSGFVTLLTFGGEITQRAISIFAVVVHYSLPWKGI